MSVWVLIGVDFTSFTRTPVTGVGSTVYQCECSSEWILPLLQVHQWLVLGQQYVSVSAHWSGFYLFHKDTSDWCWVNSMSVWVLIGVDFTSFTRTPVTGVGSTVCQCECSSEWILPLSQGHQWLVSGQQYVSVSAHRSGLYLFHKDTSDWCWVNSLSVWVVIWVDFTSFTRTPAIAVRPFMAARWRGAQFSIPPVMEAKRLLRPINTSTTLHKLASQL